MTTEKSIIIINANILTMDQHLNVYPNGYIKKTKDLIDSVGEDY